ncbi:MAG: glycosyltransferase family 2 protein [Pseudomonadota bacterium]
MSGNKVSIVVAVYKKEEYLVDTIESIISQKHRDIEIILINDGSPDGCPEICESYSRIEPRIKYISQENAGVARARNLGIACATGDYIVSFDADDIMPEDFIKNLLDFALKSPDVDVVVPRAIAFGDKEGEGCFPRIDLPSMLIRNGITNSSMFKASAIKIVNGYNENMKNGLEDWDFWLYFLEKNMIVQKTEDAFFYYRIILGSRNNISPSERLLLKRQIYLNHKDLYEKWRPNRFFVMTYPLVKLFVPFGVSKEMVRLAKFFKKLI